MIEKTIGFIGGGRVTRIILEGFKRKGLAFKKAVVSDINPEALKLLKEKFPDITLAPDNNPLPASGDIVFMALHPPAVLPALSEIRSSLRQESVLISLAPKITIAKISEILGGFSRIIRMIPNAPSLVNKGYNPLVFWERISRLERDQLLSLFAVLGECPVVKEETLEAYALLAAMGPTYFWFQWEELENLGAAFGLEREAARQALSAMVGGAERAYFHSGLTWPEVIDLIPVKPLKEDEEDIRSRFRQRLGPLYEKIKP
jgi:pyrroline-5-carboxylate reductase